MARLYTTYYSAATKREKPVIGSILVQCIRQLDPPGRFLKRNAATGGWEEAAEEVSREKACQSLRDSVLSQQLQIDDEKEKLIEIKAAIKQKGVIDAAREAQVQAVKTTQELLQRQKENAALQAVSLPSEGLVPLYPRPAHSSDAAAATNPTENDSSSVQEETTANMQSINSPNSSCDSKQSPPTKGTKDKKRGSAFLKLRLLERRMMEQNKTKLDRLSSLSSSSSPVPPLYTSESTMEQNKIKLERLSSSSSSPAPPQINTAQPANEPILEQSRLARKRPRLDNSGIPTSPSSPSQLQSNLSPFAVERTTPPAVVTKNRVIQDDSFAMESPSSRNLLMFNTPPQSLVGTMAKTFDSRRTGFFEVAPRTGSSARSPNQSLVDYRAPAKGVAADEFQPVGDISASTVGLDNLKLGAVVVPTPFVPHFNKNENKNQWLAPKLHSKRVSIPFATLQRTDSFTEHDLEELEDWKDLDLSFSLNEDDLFPSPVIDNDDPLLLPGEISLESATVGGIFEEDDLMHPYHRTVSCEPVVVPLSKPITRGSPGPDDIPTIFDRYFDNSSWK